MRRTLFLSQLALTFALGVRPALAQTDPSAAAPDLSVAISQLLVDKVLADVAYPWMMFDQQYPHDRVVPFRKGLGPADQELTQQQVRAVMDASDRAQDRLAGEVGRWRAEFNRKLDALDADRRRAEEERSEYKGPTKEEVEAWRTFRGGGVLHLARLAVSVPSRPSLVLNGAKTDFRGLHVDVSATSELWLKVPVITGCTRKCCAFKCFCCWPKIGLRWQRIVSVPVTVPFQASGSVLASYFAPHVVLKGSFSSLGIDFPLIGLIPLEGVANSLLSNKSLKLLDADNLIATLPYVDLTYKVDRIEPTGTGELRVNAWLKRKSTKVASP